MKKTKLLNLLVLASTSLFLAGCFGQEDEGEVDATLYHLELSSNLQLTNEQKGELKATYGAGEPSATVVEGVRDEDEIAALKDAGATDEDIAKAGVRQEDGSYYFFDQDPIYLEYPAIDGYYLDGFYYKDNNQLAIRPFLSKGPDQSEYTLPRWNMDNRDVELVAKYNECRYHPYFNNMAEGDTNPNNLPDSYWYGEDGVVELLPATTTNPHKHFVTWTYSKYVLDEWTTFPITELPINYDEESLRIEAVWEVDKFSIDFDFKLDEGLDTLTPVNWEDVVEKIAIIGNLTTVDGEVTIQDVVGGGDGIEVNPQSEILTPFIDEMNSDPWINIFVTAKSGYKLWKYGIEGTELDGRFSEEYGYFGLHGSDFKDNQSTIELTFVID